MVFIWQDTFVIAWFQARKSIEDSDENETNVDENSVPGLFNDSDDDSDSDTDQSKRKKSNMSMDVVKNPGKFRDLHFLTGMYYRVVYGMIGTYAFNEKDAAKLRFP